MRLRLLVAVAATVLSLTSAAQAANGIFVTATGSWNTGAEVSVLSAPNETWSLSFETFNPVTQGSTPDSTVAVQDISYTLNGTDITSTLPTFSLVQFYDSGLGGGFDFEFGPVLTFSIYSDSVIDDSNPNLVTVLQTANLSVRADVDYGAYSNGQGTGFITISPANVPPYNPNPPPTPVGTVPEPATWAFMVLGLGMVGAALRRRPQALAA